MKMSVKTSYQIKWCGYFSHPLEDKYGSSSKAQGTGNIFEEIETITKNCSGSLQTLKRKI